MPDSEPLSGPVRQMQLVVGGLTLSPILFAVFTLVAPITPLGPEASKLLVTIGLVVGLAVLLLYRPLGALLANQSYRRIDPELAKAEPTRLAEAYLAGLLVAAALCEGGAFINLIAFWVTRSPWNMALALMLITTALTRFPTERGVTAWLQQMPNHE